MEAEVQKLLDAIVDLQEKANVNACFGEPVTVENRTVIPVARLGYGFGMGIGQGPTAKEAEEATDEILEQVGVGGGGGGGMAATPMATIELTPEGTQVKSVIDEQKVALAGMLVGAWSLFWLAQALIAIFGRRE